MNAPTCYKLNLIVDSLFNANSCWFLFQYVSDESHYLAHSWNTIAFLKCYYDQKLTSIFFFHKSKVLMLNTYHAKLQVFMSTRSVINWAIISGFGRPPLQNSNLAGNNWESWGGRGVTSSNPESKNNVTTLVCGKWVPERFLKLFFYECDRNSNWTRPWQEYAS